MRNFLRKLWYSLTKTDYVIVHESAFYSTQSRHFVVRIYVDSRGVAYYLHNGVRTVEKPDQVMWPTCLPEKYMTRYYLEKKDDRK